jgi:hypothetical protein
MSEQFESSEGEVKLKLYIGEINPAGVLRMKENNARLVRESEAQSIKEDLISLACNVANGFAKVTVEHLTAQAERARQQAEVQQQMRDGTYDWCAHFRRELTPQIAVMRGVKQFIEEVTNTSNGQPSTQNFVTNQSISQHNTTINVGITTKTPSYRGRQFQKKKIKAFEEYKASGDIDKALKIINPSFCELRNPRLKEKLRGNFKRSYQRWLSKQKESLTT